jgi:hypothetical protein
VIAIHVVGGQLAELAGTQRGNDVRVRENRVFLNGVFGAAQRCRSQCLIDAVVSALVMVASSVNLDYSSNAKHRSCPGDFH